MGAVVVVAAMAGAANVTPTLTQPIVVCVYGLIFINEPIKVIN